jgi:hypothetical protein
MGIREDRARGAEGWLSLMIEKGAKEPHAGFFDISPDRARVMLNRNEGNRRLRRSLVARLREDIQGGRWQVNGESLIFSRDGLLNDGQHRLHAIIEADRAVRLVIVFGVTRESRLTLDLGANRGPEDVLHFLGHHYAAALAATARLVLAFEESEGKNFQPLRWLSKTAVVERAHADETLTESVHWAVSAGFEARQFIPAAPLAMIHYVLTRVNPEGAADYLRGVVTGINLPAHSPALSVRRYLFGMNNRSEREAMIALVLRGWALFAQGRTAEPGDLHGRSPLPGIGRYFPQEV